MSEYTKLTDGGYVAEKSITNESGPVFSVISVYVIEANNPALGPVGDMVRMAPGAEGLVTLDVDGGPNICTDAEADLQISFPDPCSWLGANQINASVTNEFGSARVEFFIIVQDSTAFCGP